MNDNLHNPNPSGPVIRRPSVLDQFLPPQAGATPPPTVSPTTVTQPVAAPPVTPSGTAAAEKSAATPSCVGVAEVAVSSVDVLLSDGRHLGVQYHLVRPILWDRKQGTIELRCDTYTLQIKGHQLAGIYKMLLAGRITYIQPLADARFDPASRLPLVTQITLQRDTV